MPCLATYRKAILAGLIAGVGVLTTASLDEQIVLHEWLVAAGATLVAIGGVYQVKNESE